MHKYIYNSIIILFIVVGISCENKDSKLLHLSDADVTLDRRVDSLLQIFLNENNVENCQYFLLFYHIQRTAIITFIANDYGQKYHFRQQSLFYIKKYNRDIYILTGAENIFNYKIKNCELVKHKNKWCYSKLKSYTLENNIIKEVPFGVIPFENPPVSFEVLKKFN